MSDNYNLDAAFYYTALGLNFDACLKFSSIKLELLSNYDMLLMCEKGKLKKEKNDTYNNLIQ